MVGRDTCWCACVGCAFGGVCGGGGWGAAAHCGRRARVAVRWWWWWWWWWRWRSRRHGAERLCERVPVAPARAALQGIEVPRPRALVFNRMSDVMFETTNWQRFKAFVRKVRGRVRSAGLLARPAAARITPAVPMRSLAAAPDKHGVKRVGEHACCCSNCAGVAGAGVRRGRRRHGGERRRRRGDGGGGARLPVLAVTPLGTSGQRHRGGGGGGGRGRPPRHQRGGTTATHWRRWEGVRARARRF